MNGWEAALLGLVQGLTEFLPVSSSGHLVLGEYLLGLNTAAAGNVTFEVFLHFGTVLSIITVYYERVWHITRETLAGLSRPGQMADVYRARPDFRFGVFVAITLIPTGIVYVLFKDPLEAAFQNPRLVCGALLFTGLLLILTRLRKHPQGEVTPVKAFVIGVAQSAAMIPGVSRSGSTICTALYQNVSPAKAADFSFIMLLPVVLGATLLKSIEMAEVGLNVGVVPLVVGTLVAYAAGVAAIRFMIGLVSRGSIHYFAYYCFVIGALGLIFI